MTLARSAYALLLVCSSGSACEVPTLAAIPEHVGDAVARVLIEVRRYSDAMVEYTACLRAELEAAGGDAAPALQRTALILRNNNAVAEHKAVLDLYEQRVGPLETLRLAEYVDGEGSTCVLGSSIRSTGIVNDGAVIFFALNKKAYLNVLPASCPGLASEGGFLVGTQAATASGTNPATRGAISPFGPGAPGGGTPLTRRVCDQDRIFPGREGSERRVLGCPLGRFFPISEEQALQILTTQGP
jgi:hypothetical protein